VTLFEAAEFLGDPRDAALDHLRRPAHASSFHRLQSFRGVSKFGDFGVFWGDSLESCDQIFEEGAITLFRRLLSSSPEPGVSGPFLLLASLAEDSRAQLEDGGEWRGR